MDPRPYHYEYRKPRPDNKTYQSVNLYESLFNRGELNRFYDQGNTKSTFNSKNQFQKLIFQNQIKNRKNISSSLMTQNNQIRSNNNYNINQRELSKSMILQKDHHKNDQYSKKQTSLATYGKFTIPAQQNYNQMISKADSKVFDKLNQYSIRQKQQKNYSIIGNYPLDFINLQK